MNGKLPPVIRWQVDQVRKLAREQAPGAVIVIATYTREEFAEIRPGEDYDAFKRQERIFAEALVAEHLDNRVAFQEIDAAGYYRFLALRHMDIGEASRAAYAAEKFRE